MNEMQTKQWGENERWAVHLVERSSKFNRKFNEVHGFRHGDTNFYFSLWPSGDRRESRKENNTTTASAF